MIDFYNAVFFDFLPSSLTNSNLQPLLKVFSEAFKKTVINYDRVLIWTSIETLPENILDTLAADLNILWYDSAYTFSEKVSIIKSVPEVFRKIGTPFALRQALENIFGFGNIEIIENYGLPFYFKIKINVANVSVEKQQLTLLKIEFLKNVRSILEALILFIRPENSPKLYTGGACTAKIKKITCTRVY
jgi:P2-related tail formation protein